MDRRFAETRDESSAEACITDVGQPGASSVLTTAPDSSSAIAKPWNRSLRLKAVMDRLIAIALLLVLAPILSIIAIAIRAEGPGPILFRQLRHGRHGRPFEILKFRTMRSNGTNDDGTHQTKQNDERTTFIGKLLRRTSLDELPQLFNVLKGDMSLVGPRPHPIPLDRRYERWISGYSERYRMKPGITGWAQVHGWRGAVHSVAIMRERIEHDNAYIDQWSPLLDLKILVMTIRFGFVHKNAY
jgi:exopolysaccharide biosynthesis polyprenyl glycosylphosphotransferase